jgi:TRAP-type mannitol/chloroaromatic compound transport system substrate-binding protein
MENTKNKTKTKKKTKEHKSTLDELGSQVEKFAVKTAESVKKVIDKALAARNTVMSIRINEDSNKKLKMLVDVGLFKSRSESAAFLIQEGIKSQDALFDKISSKVKKIDQIKKEIKGIVSQEIEKEST